MFIYKILFSDSPLLERFIILFAFLFSVVTSIVLHELGHGYMAKWNGDLTAKDQGRLTLNPIKHFDLFGVLMFMLCGFGWAKPVPINPYYFKDYKKGLVLTSLAGVMMNLIILIVSFGALAGFLSIKNIQNNFAYYLVLFLTYYFLYNSTINASLIAFNLLPIYPLDGFRLVEALTKPNNGYVTFMRHYGNYIIIALVIIGNAFPIIDVFGYYISGVQKLIYKLIYLIIGGNS